MSRPEKQAAANLVVCSTCRLSNDARTDPAGTPGGVLFGRVIGDALTRRDCSERVALQSMPCLFACGSHCTVFIRSERRMGYLLGHFMPVRAHADALLDYVERYLDTERGMVPYAQWPEGVKGHFLARVPPEGVWSPSA